MSLNGWLKAATATCFLTWLCLLTRPASIVGMCPMDWSFWIDSISFNYCLTMYKAKATWQLIQAFKTIQLTKDVVCLTKKSAWPETIVWRSWISFAWKVSSVIYWIHDILDWLVYFNTLLKECQREIVIDLSEEVGDSGLSIAVIVLISIASFLYVAIPVILIVRK